MNRDGKAEQIVTREPRSLILPDRRQTLAMLLAGGAVSMMGLAPTKAEAAGLRSPMQKMIVGSKAYDRDSKLTIENGKGEEQTLADYEGRFVLVNVWATWCFSCRVEMPDLDALQAAFDPETFLVMPISIDRKGIDAVMPFYDRTGISNLDIFTSTGVAAVHAFGERGIPFTILLDPKGEEFGRILGPVKWDSEDFVAFLKDKIASWNA